MNIPVCPDCGRRIAQYMGQDIHGTAYWECLICPRVNRAQAVVAPISASAEVLHWRVINRALTRKRRA